MGASLVAQVIARWSHIGDGAFRALIQMALTSLDKPSKDGKVPAGVYFGGHKGLAIALGKGPWSPSVKKAVQRAMKEILSVGAAECVQGAVSNDNAIYRLTLDGAPRIYERDLKRLKDLKEQWIKQGDTGRPPQGDTGRPPQGDTGRPPQGDTGRPSPYKEEEPLEEPKEELKEEYRVDQRGPVTQRARDAPDNNPQPIPTNRCPNPTCVMGYVIDDRRNNIKCPHCNPPNTSRSRAALDHRPSTKEP